MVAGRSRRQVSMLSMLNILLPAIFIVMLAQILYATPTVSTSLDDLTAAATATLNNTMSTTTIIKGDLPELKGDGGRGDERRYFRSRPYASIERISWPDTSGGCCRRPGRLLLLDLQRQQRPAILTGTPAASWSALTKWQDVGYLQSVLKSQMSGVYVTARAGDTAFTYDNRDRTTYAASQLIPQRHETNHVPTRSFLEAISSKNQSNLPAVMYLNCNLKRPDVAPLRADLTPFDFMRPPLGPLVDKQTAKISGIENNLWLSGPKVTTTAHFDSTENLFAQIVGRKRFLLAPPEETFRLYPMPAFHPSERQSSGGYFDEQDKDVFRPLMPFLGTATPIEAVLEPGEVLYVPTICTYLCTNDNVHVQCVYGVETPSSFLYCTCCVP